MFLAEPPKPEDLITTLPEVLLEKDLVEILTALEFKRELVSIFSQMVVEPPVMITIEGESETTDALYHIQLKKEQNPFKVAV